jgi:Abortive infection alpha
MDEETIKEVSRASRAIAKTTGQAIGLVRAFGGWLNKVFGRPIVNTVDLVWTDRAETRRIRSAIYDYKNLALLFAAVEKELAKRGIKRIRALVPKVALPLLERATMENESSLRALWAQLLASGLAGEKLDTTYVKALSELTGRDAKILRSMYLEWKRKPPGQETTIGAITYEAGIDAEKGSSRTVSKLFSLGIVRPTYVSMSIFIPEGHSRYGSYGPSEEYATVPGDLTVVRFSEFGENFYKTLGIDGKTRRAPKRRS